jgi:hypothetical protein
MSVRRWTVALAGLALLFPLSLAAQGGGGELATFEATGYGDLTAGPQAREQSIRDNTTQVVISKPGIRWDLTFFQGVEFKVPGDGADCFHAGHYGGPGERGSMHIVQERDDSGLASIWFEATANDRISDLLYRLDVYGYFDHPANWPPALGTSNTLRVESWEMTSEGKGKLKNISCTGTGVFLNPTSIEVVRVQ